MRNRVNLICLVLWMLSVGIDMGLHRMSLWTALDVTVALYYAYSLWKALTINDWAESKAKEVQEILRKAKEQEDESSNS